MGRSYVRRSKTAFGSQRPITTLGMVDTPGSTVRSLYRTNALVTTCVRSPTRVPETHYYLGDGGYSRKHRTVLVPYQRTRYHLDLREIADIQQRPASQEELFNLRHACLKM